MIYVKVQNGKIVEGPAEVSPNESDSPNTNWGAEQMKLNGIFLVDLDHDPLTEKIDYDNPVIYSNSVVYPKISLSTAEAITASNAEAIQKRLAEYPTSEEKLNALWEYTTNNDQSLLNNLSNKISQINKKYPLQ